MVSKKYKLDKDRVKRQLEGSLKSFEMWKTHIKNDKNDIKVWPIIDDSSRCAKHLKNIACFEYLLEPDVKKFYERLRTAVSYQRLALELVKKLPESEWPSYSDYPSQGIGISALSDCIIAAEFATGKLCATINKPFIKPTKKQVNEGFYVQYDIRETICLDINSLNKIIPRFEPCIEWTKKRMKSMVPIMELERALVQKDQQTFNDRIISYLDNYDKDIMKHACPDISVTTLRYCHTAMLLGMEVNIDHQFLPKELILSPDFVCNAYNKSDLVPLPEI